MARTILFIDTETLEYDFDAIEQECLSGSIGFGNPHSKLTRHEQFLLWKKMIQEGTFVDRDEYCNKMVEYSTYEQGLQYLNRLPH